VPACGYDSIPSDISAYLSAKTLETFCSSEGKSYPGVDKSLSSIQTKGGFSGGTIASILNMLDTSSPKDMQEMMREHYLSPGKSTFSYS
jgi:short subunit dehydrogenase-like uncharacterized protein